MSSLTNTTLKGSDAISRVFIPRDIKMPGRVGIFAEAAAVPMAENKLTISTRETPQSGKRRVTMKLTLPVVQQAEVSGITAPRVVRTAFAEVTFTFDQSSTEDERALAVSLLRDALSADKTVLSGILVNLNGVY